MIKRTKTEETIVEAVAANTVNTIVISTVELENKSKLRRMGAFVTTPAWILEHAGFIKKNSCVVVVKRSAEGLGESWGLLMGLLKRVENMVCVELEADRFDINVGFNFESGSELQQLMIANELLERYQFSGRSPRRALLVENESLYLEWLQELRRQEAAGEDTTRAQGAVDWFESDEPDSTTNFFTDWGEGMARCQAEWHEEHNAAYQEYDPDLSIKAEDRDWEATRLLKESFAGDSWVFAGSDSIGMMGMIFDDDFLSISTKGKNGEPVDDYDYDEQVLKSLRRIYPEDLSMHDQVQATTTKFMETQSDRLIYEDCEQMAWMGAKTIRHPQLVGPHYRITESQYHLEDIKSFTGTTIKAARKLQEAYMLLELPFMSVKEISGQIRKGRNRSPLDATITDWFEPNVMFKRRGFFNSTETWKKYINYPKERLWHVWSGAYPEGTVDEFNERYPDGRVTLNELIEEMVLPELMETQNARMVDAQTCMDVDSYEKFKSIGAQSNWRVSALEHSIANDLGIEGAEATLNTLTESIRDREERALDGDARAHLEIRIEDLYDRSERMSTKRADLMPFTFWALERIPFNPVLQSTSGWRQAFEDYEIADYHEAMRKLGHTESKGEVQDLISDMRRDRLLNATHFFQLFMPMAEKRMELFSIYGSIDKSGEAMDKRAA